MTAINHAATFRQLHQHGLLLLANAWDAGSARLIESLGAKAIATTSLDTVVGNIRWGRDNVPPFARKNVAKTPLVGGQWRRKADGSFDLLIVENGNAPNIPLGGTLETLR